MAKAGKPTGRVRPPFWKRLWVQAVTVLVVLAVLGLVGLFAYRKWEPIYLAGKAQELYDKGDLPAATLAARRTLQVDPTNKVASRLMTLITDRVGAPEELGWRQRMGELSPGSKSEAFAWAASALELRRPEAALKALQSVQPADQNTATYHSLAGLAAISAGKLAEALQHFTKAHELAPEAPSHQYNLALMQVQSPEAAVREQGWQTMRRLAEGGPMQLLAMRSLINDLAMTKKLPEALQLSTRQVQLPGVEFRDRLMHLDLLHAAKSPELPAALKSSQAVALTGKEEDAASLVNWLRLHGQAEDAVQWSATLPEKLAKLPRVAMARAEALSAAGKWSDLRTEFDQTNWADLEALRYAFLTRAYREAGDIRRVTSLWKSALQATRVAGGAAYSAPKQRELLQQLAYFASQWGWSAEFQDTLWYAATNSPAPQWALQMLHRYYQGQGNTAGMLKVAKRFVEVEPTSQPARNNIYSLTLLLNQPGERIVEGAGEIYRKAPANPAYASTYALALLKAGRAGEALQVMEKLSPEQRQQGSPAAYYSLILAANGRSEEAAKAREAALASPLLPEEKALLTQTN